MNERPLNLVFFPHSVNFGLAGTNRLQNIIYFLNKCDVDSIANIALEPKADLTRRNDSARFISNYREIYYGPTLIDFIKHIFKTCAIIFKLKKAKNKNIIFFYGEIDIKNFQFILWAKLLGYKVIIDVVEDLSTITIFKSFKNKLKYKSAIFFRRHLNFFADGFVTLSVHLAKLLNDGFANKPLFFLPVTVNKFLLAPGATVYASELTTIFYGGSFNEKDGLPYLLDALSELKKTYSNFRLVVSGKGTEPEMESFFRLIEQKKLIGLVEYRGFLSRQNYIKLLSLEADVLCMTRINSAFANAGFPFKLGEFLATGKPVIASRVGDVTKYLSPEDAYLVEPENAGQITQSLLAIINDVEAAKRIGFNGKKVAMKFFDHETYAANLKQFLIQI